MIAMDDFIKIEVDKIFPGPVPDELMQLLRERYIGKLAAYSKLDRAKWEESEHKTTWFSAEKAKDWGLVDKIE